MRQQQEMLRIAMGTGISISDYQRDCTNVTSSKTSQYVGLTDFFHFYSPIHGYVCVLLCIFGIVANLANIIILTRKSMRSSVNWILTWLAVADLATMFFYFFQLIHFNIFSPKEFQNIPHTYSSGWIMYSLIVISLVLVLHTVACWLTVALAIFRYLYIALPTRGAQIANFKNATITIVATFIVFGLTTVPNYLVNAPRACLSNSTNKIVYFINYPDTINYNLIMSNYWTIAILYKIIPCILLLVMTLLLIVEMSKASKRRKKLLSSGKTTKKDQKKDSREQRTTAMLLTIVILFLLTELPQGIMSLLCFIIENFQDDIYHPLGDVVDLLSLINNSVNFILYTTMSKQFRDTFKEVFLFWWPAKTPTENVDMENRKLKDNNHVIEGNEEDKIIAET